MYNRNRFDNRGAMERGNKAVDLFVKLAKLRGWVVEKSLDFQDIYQHIDYSIHKAGTVYSVDVKAAKRIRASDPLEQYSWVWLELRGVNNKGWIYGGKADLIAFQTMSGFLFVKRENLIPFIAQHIDKTKLALRPELAHYGLYYRRGGKDSDILSLVELKRLEKEIRFGVWTE